MQPTPRARRIRAFTVLAAAGSAMFVPSVAAAATHDAAAVPQPVWGIPVRRACCCPRALADRRAALVAPRMGLISAAWTLAAAGADGNAERAGAGLARRLACRALEYLPFVTLLLALFTAGGGILLEGGPWGTPGGQHAPAGDRHRCWPA